MNSGVRPTAESLGFDPADTAFVADPYPCYSRMQEAGPVLWSQSQQMWLVSRYEDCNRLLRHPSLARVFQRREPEQRWQTFNWLNDQAMLDTEGATHTRMRRLLSPQFTRTGLADLSDAVDGVCTDLVAQAADALAAQGVFDLVSVIAEQLPIRVVCALLGIPPEDQHKTHDWSLAMVRLFEYARSPEDDERGIQGAEAFAVYMSKLLEVQGPAPAAMLTLANAVEDATLDRREAVANAILLFNGGTGATINALGNGLVLLLADPAQRNAVIEDEAWECAVEEFLRYEAPLQLFERQVVGAADDLGLPGVQSGDRIGLLLGAANRDASRFADSQTFDPLRPVQPHLTFSAGTHFCLGAPLARMELQAILRTLLTALPNLNLAGKPEPEHTYVVRGHRRIPVSHIPMRQ